MNCDPEKNCTGSEYHAEVRFVTGRCELRIYLLSGDGDIFVVKAGAEFQLLSTNPMGERLMATPALSDGRMYVRGEKNLFAVGR
jgi:hypothetical protein